MNAVASFLHHWLIDDPAKWHPLLGVFYLTYRCDFRCPHCADGSGEPYYRLPSKVLPPAQVRALLQTMRRHCDYLVITGGEPTLYPEFERVLADLPEQRFRGVILTTNGYGLEACLPTVMRSVHQLVISLQTMDSAKADRWYGRASGTHQRVLENLERARRFPRRRCEIIISTVVTPDNIGDLYDLYEYTQDRGFRLAACPQLVGVKAHAALLGDAQYRGFYDFLIAEKRRGGNIEGTVDYLTYMRDLAKFACRPFTMLVVSPTGEVFYPCLELGQFAGNLLSEPNLHRLRQLGNQRFGPQPACDARCHSACALGFSRLLANPACVLGEAVWWLKRKSRKPGRGSAREPTRGNVNSTRLEGDPTRSGGRGS